MKSVIQMLGTKEFIRIRVGIGSPDEHIDLISHVIQKLNKEEYKQLEAGIDKGVEAICEIMKNGIDASMNKFN